MVKSPLIWKNAQGPGDWSPRILLWEPIPAGCWWCIIVQMHTLALRHLTQAAPGCASWRFFLQICSLENHGGGSIEIIGYPNSEMVYFMENPSINGFRGTPLSGNLHFSTHTLGILRTLYARCWDLSLLNPVSDFMAAIPCIRFSLLLGRCSQQ
jgi:hypothetical protein